MTGRDGFGRYRELMAAHGFRPSRRLGQNFLLDASLHRAIVDTAGIEPNDCVLEVGAGLGFLTRELAARAARVVAVEIDRRLASILRGELAVLPEGGRVDVIEADVLHGEPLQADVASALVAAQSACSGGFAVVANLPYAIAGPFLARLPLLDPAPDRGAVLVQLELGQRLVAAPGDRVYGALSVVLGACYELRLARRVGREVFRPRPAVDSALVEFRRRGDSELWRRSAAERRAFGGFVRALFGQRRKQLRSAFAVACARVGAAPAAVPAALAKARPEALSWQQHLELWRSVAGFS